MTAQRVQYVRIPDSTAPKYIDLLMDGEVDGSTLDVNQMLLIAHPFTAVTITGAEMVTPQIIRLYVDEIPAAERIDVTLCRVVALSYSRFADS